ncbi:GDP-mannose 4,6-dehydratase [Pseudomonadota bacterium]
MKKALICGVSGQDGAYLAKFLLDKGYEVYGASRDAQVNQFRNLETLGISQDIQLISMALSDFRSVLQALKNVQPDEVYNLAGQSSVGLSFMQPVETMESITIGTLNLLESIRFLGNDMKLYNSGSGECFGDTGDVAADENTPFRPRSPYAVAKSAAHWTCSNYREAYNLYACTGILFNHESPLRPDRFVTQKIVRAACRIADGDTRKLKLGNISIKRDWGWAPEFVKAMWLMMQQETPQDFVIATGQNNSLEEFINCAFLQFDLDWRDHVQQDQQYMRPTDISSNKGDPSKARDNLKWVPEYHMTDVVNMMVKSATNDSAALSSLLSKKT